MSVADEIREQKSKFHNMSTTQKLKYIIYYYKWWILLSVIVIWVISGEIYRRVSDKPDAFVCLIINASTFDSTPKNLLNDYVEYSSINSKKYDVILDSSYIIDFNNSEALAYNNAERIQYQLEEGLVDAIIAPEDIATEYMEKGYLDSMVDITSFEHFKTYDLYPNRGPIFYCITKNSPHLEQGEIFLEFLK